MNYMAEINAFYDWQEANRLPPSAICLWHALMNIANKARWPADFTVARSTLESKTRYGKNAIYEARNILKQKGRIDFKAGKGSGTATYRLISFASGHQTQYTTQPPTQGQTQPPTQFPTINIQDYTRRDDTFFFVVDDEKESLLCAREGLKVENPVENIPAELVTEAGRLFGAYFGRRPTPYDLTHLYELVRKGSKQPDGTWTYGLDWDKLGVVGYAFEVAARANALNWPYVDAVLSECARRGLKTRDDCENYDVDRDFQR